MEFDLMNISETASYQLGFYDEDQFIAEDNAEEVIEDILSSILTHKTNWDVQAGLHRMKYLENDLIPLITSLKDEGKLFGTCMKLLLHLTQPVDCLYGTLTYLHDTLKTEVRRALLGAKQSINAKPELFQVIYREINEILDSCVKFRMSKEDGDTINNSLLFLRNILHITNDKEPTIDNEMLQHILTGFPEIFKRLMLNTNKKTWTVAIVQLLSLIFKDASAVTLMLTLSMTEKEENSSKFICYSSDEESEGLYDNTQSENGLEKESSNGDVEASLDRYDVDEKVLKVLAGNTQSLDEKLEKQLADFGLTVLQHGLNGLIADLHEYLLDQNSIYLDESYMTWVISYFLKFVFLSGIEYRHVKEAICKETVGYLTYKAVQSIEEFKSSQLKNENDELLETFKLRKVHLTVMALREIFHTINFLSNSVKLSQEDEINLKDDKFQIASLLDLKLIFLLLIRSCPLEERFRIYLRDLVTTNHAYLLLVEHLLNHTNEASEKFQKKFSMLTHVNLFANKTIVRAYGYLLETYEENTPCLNDCVMTMLHHISGDCKKPETLLQLPILNTFMEMYENQFPLAKESTELIEYILCKFEATANRKVSSAFKSDECGNEELYSDSGVGISDGNSMSDSTSLESSESESIEDTPEKLHPMDSVPVEEHPILHQLLNVSRDYVHSLRTMTPTVNDGLTWVTHVLEETCFVKLIMDKNADIDHLEEPIPYHYCAFEKSVPIVPYTVEQNNILNDYLFLSLLRQLGFYLPEGKERLFPRIPSLWGPEKLHRMATFLGSSHTQMKYSEADVKTTENLLEKQMRFFAEPNKFTL